MLTDVLLFAGESTIFKARLCMYNLYFYTSLALYKERERARERERERVNVYLELIIMLYLC